MAVLAAVSFVLIASLLVFNASDNDGEGSNDTTEVWKEANAVIFTSGQSPGCTYYKTIQGAVNAAEASVDESSTISRVTIYVKEQIITEKISVGYVPINIGDGLLEITIKGIAEPATTEPDDGSPVKLTKDKQLDGPVFYVEGRLILEGITIMDESANPSDGDESQNAPAI